MVIFYVIITFITVLNFGTERSELTVQTDPDPRPDQTAPESESDQGLHCLPFSLHLLDTYPDG